MRQGRSARSHRQLAWTIGCVVSVALAPATAAGASSQAAALAQRVATATDAQNVIAMRQQLPASSVDLTYSDAPERVAVEFAASKLVSGDIRGKWFASTTGRCFIVSEEPFVGLTSIGRSLLPQASSTAGATVAYWQIDPHALEWRIKARSGHVLQRATVWFNTRDLIIKAREQSYRRGEQAPSSTVTLTYLRRLPSTLPTRVPSPACRAKGRA